MLNTKSSTSANKGIGIWHLIAGIIMALLGVYVWFNPVVSLVALALYLGIGFIIVGAGYIAFSFSFQSGWYLLVGLLDIFVGIIFVSNLGVTAETLPIIFAVWCLAVGIIQLANAWELRKIGLNWGWCATAGALGVVFAFLILAFPVLGALTITAIMGAYIVLYGLVEIGEYYFLRRVMAN